MLCPKIRDGPTRGYSLARQICYLLCIPGKGPYQPFFLRQNTPSLLVAFRAFTMPYMVICKHSKTLPA